MARSPLVDPPLVDPPLVDPPLVDLLLVDLVLVDKQQPGCCWRLSWGRNGW